MLFSSITFLYYFLPIVMIVYFVVPNMYRNVVLLIFSLLFYAWGEPIYILLMIFTIVESYLIGRCIEHSECHRKKKMYLGIGVILGISLLLYFKYSDFIILNINEIANTEIDLLKLSLPIGISFFTFQTISYVIDVYRRDVSASNNIINYATYVCMFPQLIAGPIVRYADINDELTYRELSTSNVYDGIARFLVGLSKKVLIANLLGELCQIFLTSDPSVLFYWMYAISFSLHIYFDFSAYSDMAIGLGKIFGFTFLENFNYPFISKSITEFWRRWHISLGNWFRDYVYIPLGGNRKGLRRTIINIFIVWMLTGLWHGSNYTFIVWGLLFAILLLIEKLFLLTYLKKMKGFAHVYTLFFVGISFMIFDAPSVSIAIERIFGLFAFTSLPLVNDQSMYYLNSYFIIIGFAIFSATPIPTNFMKKLRQYRWSAPFEVVGLILLLFVVTAFLVDGSYNPFLYFRF